MTQSRMDYLALTILRSSLLPAASQQCNLMMRSLIAIAALVAVLTGCSVDRVTTYKCAAPTGGYYTMIHDPENGTMGFCGGDGAMCRGSASRRRVTEFTAKSGYRWRLDSAAMELATESSDTVYACTKARTARGSDGHGIGCVLLDGFGFIPEPCRGVWMPPA